MAYAAVVSALHKMETFIQSSQSNDPILNSAMESIHKGICYMEMFLRILTPVDCRKMGYKDADQQFQYFAEKFEDLMESHQLVSDSVFAEKLLEVKQELSSFIAMLEKKESEQQLDDYMPTDEAVSQMLAGSGLDSSKLVGMDDEIQEVVTNFLRSIDKQKMILAVVGMPGIGKTTLVQLVCDHPDISCLFESRILVRVGPYCESRDLLLLLLRYLRCNSCPMHENLSDIDLRSHVKIALSEKRYMIVLDDVWRSYSDIIRAVQDGDNNHSRFILTTTLWTVEKGFPESDIILHEKKFLTDEDSWNLLRETVFDHSQESCSLELEEIGKEIAANCEGLPLGVISIAELLSKIDRTVECWKKVSKDENPLRIGVDNTTPIARPLLLSYNMLEYNLQVCLLHVGVFPRDYEIFVSNLVKLWAAEGFFRSSRSQSLENVAYNSLLQLHLRNVVLVPKLSSKGNKIKKCRVHTTFRNLCINIAQSRNFCYVVKKYSYSFPQGTNRQRRLCIHNHVMLAIKEAKSTMESLPFVHSLLCFGPQHEYPLCVFLSFRLLRVLDALRLRFYTFPNEVPNLVTLKYLTITCDEKLPKSISKLQNLEVLVVGRHHRIKSSHAPSYLPTEIWSLRCLKHLKCMGTDLPDPCPDIDGLQNLLTLSGVSARSCTKRILQRIPKLKKLGIHIELAIDEVETFSFINEIAEYLPCLKSLKCVVQGLRFQVVSTIPQFPRTLEKLSLSGCGFLWKDIAAISKLIFLEVLKLRWCAFRGPIWNTCKKDFQWVQYFLLEDMDIEEWNTPAVDCFKCLEHLVIRHCYKLNAVPKFAKYSHPEINRRVIELDDCSTSAVKSTNEVQSSWNAVVITHSLDDDDKKNKTRS